MSLCVYFNSAGTKGYDKLLAIISKTQLVNDIGKLSADAQTSCIEGFHATLNHWHPKMIAFSYLGSYCRYNFYKIRFMTCSNMKPHNILKNG